MLPSKLAVVLLIIALAVGLLGVWHLRSLEEDKSLLKDQIIADLKATVQSNQQALSLKTQSCEIDNSLIAQLDSDRQEIDVSSKVIDEQLVSLKITPIKKEVSNVNANVQDSVSQISVVPDNGILSDNLTRLLKQSYCNTEPEDSSCVSTR